MTVAITMTDELPTAAEKAAARAVLDAPNPPDAQDIATEDLTDPSLNVSD